MALNRAAKTATPTELPNRGRADRQQNNEHFYEDYHDHYDDGNQLYGYKTAASDRVDDGNTPQQPSVPDLTISKSASNRYPPRKSSIHAKRDQPQHRYAHSSNNSIDNQHQSPRRNVRRRTLTSQSRPHSCSLSGQRSENELSRVGGAVASSSELLEKDIDWEVQHLVVSSSEEEGDEENNIKHGEILFDNDDDNDYGQHAYDDEASITPARSLRNGLLGRNRRKRARRRSAYPAGTGGGPSFAWNRGRFRFLSHVLQRNRICVLVACAVLLFTLPWLIFRSLQPFRSWETYESESSSWYPTPLGGTSWRWKIAYDKAHALVSAMTLVEKVNITTGTGWQMGPCVGNTGSARAVGFPSLCLQDGPLGIRFADNITAFPAGITTAATWDRGLFYDRGLALGREARLKGIHVLLGPSIGPMGMMPAGGRNWEGFGPDPVLSGLAATETIRGIQRNGVMATAKHLILNEQEHFRQANEWGIPDAMSVNIDDRSLREVFLWPFAESIRVNVASIMCSYQMINNTYACENSKLLNGILKDEMGFQGFVQSDWLAQRSGVTSALSGLDMSMPGDGLGWADGDSLWGKSMTIAALNGTLPMERLNDMTTRIVAAWYQLRQDSRPPSRPFGTGGPNFNSWTNEEYGLLYPGSPDDKDTGRVNYFVDAQDSGDLAHKVYARRVATDGIVLVKNEDMNLPLPRGGRSPMNPGKYKVGVYGEDADAGQGPNLCPDRACNQGTLGSGWGSGAVDFPYLITPWEALSDAWDSQHVEVKPYLTNDVKSTDLADKDLCLVFANADSGEGYVLQTEFRGDRNDLYLQKGGDRLVKRVADGCGGGKGITVVVIHNVGPVIMENWIEHPNIKGVLIANLPGQEGGHALADVLFGVADASGRLPYTIGKSLADYGKAAQVLYEPNAKIPQVNLQEAGLYIDYRHFDKFGIEPRYEFGFGLSYTTFNFDNLVITPLRTKSPLPDTRLKPFASPPESDLTIPLANETLFPWWLRRVTKFVYPYLDDELQALPKPPGEEYQYPEGYDTPQPLSEAGGGEGGNPSLYEDFVEVSFDIINDGPRRGKIVAQLYVSFPESVYDVGGDQIDFPVRVLRGFTKIELTSGSMKRVSLQLNRKDLSYWSVRQQNWVMPTEGHFGIYIGKSSRDLVLEGQF